MSPANLSRLLRLLMMLYVPFLVLLALSMIGIVVGAIILTVMAPSLLCAWLVPLVALLILTLVTFAQATQFMLRAREPDRDESELRLSRKKFQGLYDLVHKVAQDRGLRVPDEIRLAAETVAHVYEDRKGKEILVIGGFAIASFTQETLAGIIAHELAHFAAGDTRLGRKTRGRQMFMALLDDHLSGRLSSFFNPLVWMVRAYHWLYFSVWAANSRNQEIQADKQEVKQAGKDRAAAALLYTTVLARMPWLRLSDIAESHAKVNDRLDGIFAEQVRRVTTISPSDWQHACRKEMKRKTGWFDTHPQLRERLAAMGINPRKAMQLPIEASGPRANILLPDWREIEKRLTEWIVDIYRQHHAVKMEIAQIILGRSVYWD